MDEFLRRFVRRGLLRAVGKVLDYTLTMKAMEYFEKGILLKEDLEELETVIVAKNGEVESDVADV